jgi:hypothetical protein
MHGFPRLRALTIAFSAGMGIFGSRTGSYRSSLTAQGRATGSNSRMAIRKPYKRGCQETFFPYRLSADTLFGIQPPT